MAKFCPKCARGYDDAFYYCLHDGSYLTDRDPEETVLRLDSEQTVVRPMPPTEPFAPKDEKTIENPFKAEPKKVDVDINSTTNRKYSSFPVKPPNEFRTKLGTAATLGTVLGVALFVLVFLGFLIFTLLNNPSSKSQTASSATPQPTDVPRTAVSSPKSVPTAEPTPIPTPNPTPLPQRIVPASFSVESGNYYATQFNVRGKGHVVGWYQVSSFDIVVAIVREDGLACFQSRFKNCVNDPPTYYNSGGKVSSGQIDVYLATGTYYIVFSNLHASFYSKNMRTEIYLEE